MFKVEFPYDIGTFVKIKPSFKRQGCNNDVGTVACYNCVEDICMSQDVDDPKNYNSGGIVLRKKAKD